MATWNFVEFFQHKNHGNVNTQNTDYDWLHVSLFGAENPHEMKLILEPKKLKGY
jgi:hypothetical protein